VPAGRIVRLDPERGFGFLVSADGSEIYFHRNSVLGDKFSRLSVGSKVAFVAEDGDKGPQASTVRIL
jgi:cold shock CspA family protein